MKKLKVVKIKNKKVLKGGLVMVNLVDGVILVGVDIMG